MIYAVAIHLFQAVIHVPAGRSDLPENATAEHDLGFAERGVLDARPIGRAEALGEVRPGFREEVRVNVSDWHLVFRAANFALFLRRLSRVDFAAIGAHPQFSF